MYNLYICCWDYTCVLPCPAKLPSSKESNEEKSPRYSIQHQVLIFQFKPHPLNYNYDSHIVQGYRNELGIILAFKKLVRDTDR